MTSNNSRPSRVFARLLAAGFAVSGIFTNATQAQPNQTSYKFDFGSGEVAPGCVQILPDMVYSEERGYGFEPDGNVIAENREGGDALRDDFCASDEPFFFSVKVPEGNYQVTATFGDRTAATTTTVKAELRRLMLEKVHTEPGHFQTRTFIVNVRTPKITAVDDIEAGEVRLKRPRESTEEAWAWDDLLTLEFNNSRPTICALEIKPVDVPTIFLLGDSTVCDQYREPYTSWGQMFTRFFKPEVAIANHGESGESYTASLSRRRLDKVLSLMKPGDYLIMQFGHNDQKQRGEDRGPFLSYKREIKQHIAGVRKRGGIPVVVSPMERRNFDENSKIKPTLADYAEGARQAAREENVAFIDLHAMSIPFYEYLESKGFDYSRKAFALQDNTHHNNYGAYELAQCVVESIREKQLGIAKYIVDDFSGFDPSHPDPVETFDVPPSPKVTNARPLGN